MRSPWKQSVISTRAAAATDSSSSGEQRTSSRSSTMRSSSWRRARVPAEIRERLATFVGDTSGDRWSRVGKQLLTEASWFGLAFHSVFAKDGLILVGGSGNGGSRDTYEEAVEFQDPVPPRIRGSDRVSRGEIVDRYSKLTSAGPIIRSEARLVPADALARSGFVRGALAPAS